jgi:hypothetical protein
MEVSMVAAGALSNHDDTLFVKAPTADLFGISGRSVGILERNSQVLVHGEIGPYKVVSYEGRNGYVLSEFLAPHACPALEEVEAMEEYRAPKGHRFLRVTLCLMIPLAGAISTAVAVAMLA